MGDNPVSTSASSQRKLPIPANGANSNSAIKGILIKPKRILPAQPDNQKLKRSIQDTSSEYKADDNVNENSRADFNPPFKSENANKNSSHKVIIPKLQIDVDRLKSFFHLHGKTTGRTEKRKTDLNENDILENCEKDRSVPLRSQSECRDATHVFLTRENKLYKYNSDGLTKVKEWCSASEIGKMTAKMTADSSMTKSVERSIRSPSPKSNTTWDRSSSGYSSDERADPRSPPPSHSASISVSSKAETEITNDDEVSVTNTAEASENQTDTENENEADRLGCTEEQDSTDVHTPHSDDSNSSDTLVVINTSENDKELIESDNTNIQCDTCEANNNGADKIDTTNSCVSFSFDNSPATRLNTKRPTWTAHSPLPGNGRIIQYRKSGSESVISLRHPSRQGIVENNFDGLEVCGKSFPKSASNNSAKNDSSPPDGVNCEAGSRQEMLSPTSAFVPILRLNTMANSETESQQLETHSPEMAPRTRILRLPLTPCRSPRDIKSLGLGSNSKCHHINYKLYITMKIDKTVLL